MTIYCKSSRRCKSCRFYSVRTKTCDYILITGKCRGCPVDGCTKYARRKGTGKKLNLPPGSESRLYEELGGTARTVSNLTKGMDKQ